MTLRQWLQRGVIAPAETALRRHLANGSTDPELRFLLGACLQMQGLLPEALDCMDAVLAQSPAHVEAAFARGALLLQLGRVAEALPTWQSYVRTQPGDARAWNNLGLACKNLGRFEEAMYAFEHAGRLAPGFDLAHANLGNALHRLGRFHEAREAYETALRLNPRNSLTRWNLGLCRLLLGDWPGAWADYDARWVPPTMAQFAPRPFFHRPWWRGTRGDGTGTLLLHAEQGLGDTLQFVRYVPQVRDLGWQIVLEAPPSLVHLLARSFPGTTVVPSGATLPSFAAHCPLLSLPGVFQTRLDTVPAPRAYVEASSARRVQWRETLGARSRVRLGLAWSSGISDDTRHVALEQFRALDDGRFDLIGLQTDLLPSDAAALAAFRNLRWMGPQLHSFDDTAALAQECDAVISVDTSVAHLAGALGLPTWILLPRVADWRWLLDRHDSPWYPTARLIRADGVRSWSEHIAALAPELPG